MINFNLKTPVYSSIEHQVEERELSDYWLANNNNNNCQDLFIGSDQKQMIGNKITKARARKHKQDGGLRINLMPVHFD